MVEPPEPARHELDAALREADRMIRVRGDRVTVRNPARPFALAGLAAGVVATVALAVVGDADRGAVGLAVVVLLGGAAAAVGLVLALVGLGVRPVRPAARALLGVALSALVAVVVAQAAAVVLGLGD